MRPLALITGASSGLGAEFGRQAAARGMDVLLTARRLDRLENLAAELTQKHGITASVFAADLSTDDGIAEAVRRIQGEPNLELLVNNAGFGTMGPFAKATAESQDKMHHLHVLATMRLTHAALEGMLARNRGGVIQVSSVAAFQQAPGSVSYCATKTWINSFTEGLDLELRGSGTAVRVQALCPGYTVTEFHDTLGWDRGSAPKWLWLKAENVVAESLKGLDAGKLFVIPGWQYKLAVRAMSGMPRSLLKKLIIRQQRALKRA